MPRYDDLRFLPAAPVAIVPLRHPESAANVMGVPLLIDSGADVTLLPQAFVTAVGVEANSDNAYELVGFDGSMSVAQSVRIVLVFGRKTFKGRFLLIDQEWGILGRDVLNHVRLILDSPQQTWDER